MSIATRTLLLIVGATALAGCGGGGGGGNAAATPPAPLPSFTISATVTGLSGSGLALLNNNTNNTPVAASGVVTFSIAMTAGSPYNVSVGAQPVSPTQTCQVINGAGTIGAVNVTNITVNCTTNAYSVGGTVSGLSGSGLALQNNAAGEIAIAANGAFAFPSIASGSSYDISISSVPSNPVQKCTVTNGSGNVTSAVVSNIGVTCVTQVPRFAYGFNYYGGSVSIYNIDAVTGQLRNRGYAKTGQTPVDAAVNSTLTLAYILSSGVAQSPPSLPALPATNAVITAFRHDNVTGAETELSGSPYTLPSSFTNSARISLHPGDKFLYVTDGLPSSNAIYAFTVNTVTGALTPMSGSPISGGATPAAVAFNAQGTFAYVANRTSNDVSVFSVNTTSGALVEISPRVAAGTNPSAVKLHPNGRFAYTINVDSASISAYAVNAATGALSPVSGSPYSIPAFPAMEDLIHFDPSGKFAYVKCVGAPSAAGSIAGFAINTSTGALTPLSGSPYAIGINSYGFLDLGMHPTGKFLYVANRNTSIGPTSAGSVSAFSINTQTGVLTPISGIASLTPAPFSAAVDVSGNFLYVTTIEGDQIFSYRIDQNLGTLTPLPRGSLIRGGAEPLTITSFASPISTAAPVFKSKYSYVPNSSDSTITNYATSATNGALTSATSIPSGGGTSPKQVATSQGSPFAYAANATSNTVSAYTVNATTGVLSLVTVTGGTVSAGTATTAVAVDPTGRFVYALSSDASGLISAFKIKPADGTLTTNGTLTSMANPTAIAVDPTGRNLFVMSASEIRVFWIDKTSGAISVPFGAPLGPFGSGIQPLQTSSATHFAIDPGARFLYVVGSGSIEKYPINPYGGVLQSGTQMLTAKPHAAIAIDPTGRFAYTADGASITSYSINQATGELMFPTPIAPAFNALSVNVDYAGNVLYAVLADKSVATYAISQADGTLAVVPAGSVATGTAPGPITTVGEVE